MYLEKIINKYFDDFLEDLYTMLKLNTSHDASSKTISSPYGDNIVESLSKLFNYIKFNDFEVKNISNKMLEISIGHYEKTPLTFICSIDSIKNEQYKVSGGKITAPSVVEKSGFLALVHALQIYRKEFGEIEKQIRIIVCTAKYDDFNDLRYYFDNIIEDNGFNILIGDKFAKIIEEKGEVKFSIKQNFMENNLTTDYQLIKLDGTQYENGHIRKARAQIRTNKMDNITSLCKISKHTYQIDGNNITIDFYTNEKNINALFLCFTFLNNFLFDENFMKIKNFWNKYFQNDFIGKKMRVDIENSTNLGIMSFIYQDGFFEMSANLKFTRPYNHFQLISKIDDLVQGERFSFNIIDSYDTLVPPKRLNNFKFVSETYENTTKEKFPSIINENPTYLRVVSEAITFGPSFHIDWGNDEIETKELFYAIKIYLNLINNYVEGKNES